MNIGVDFHDTLSYNPKFFLNLFLNWKKTGKLFIVTGTPLSKEKIVEKSLKSMGFSGLYEKIIFGFEYSKENMNQEHFIKMREHKLKSILENDINIYFDDNPYYVDYLKNKGITVFQTILSDDYMDEFSKKDPYFTCNLQKNQFHNIYNIPLLNKKGE